jgi:hypothetical protein
MQILKLLPIGKGKYGCKYCNKAPKFQLVEASMGVGIVMKPQYCSLVEVSMGVNIATKPQNYSW